MSRRHRYRQVDESSDDEDTDEELNSVVMERLKDSNKDWDSMWQNALFEMPKETTSDAEVSLVSLTSLSSRFYYITLTIFRNGQERYIAFHLNSLEQHQKLHERLSKSTR